MNSIGMNTPHLGGEMMSDGMSEPSSPESGSFDPSDLLSETVGDDVTHQLAASGPIGIAAAAAVATGKKRKRPHHFETNPSNRKRQQTRLLRKLKATIEEYTTRVGQQAIVLCCMPGKSSQSLQAFKVFGSQPLESVMRNCRGMVMQDLEAALAAQAPPPPDGNGMPELPPLSIDGIPTPVDKMTQAQLRAFIPLMLKFSTGRGKPGWGKNDCRPVWWPEDLPWANVRSDARSEDEKQKVSWTEALRTIVKNCYKHHGREDLLQVFEDSNQGGYGGTMVQTINNPDGTISVIQIDTGANGNAVVTLADGTQATVVQAVAADHHEATAAVQTLADVASSQSDGITGIDLNHAGGNISGSATINQDGHIVFTTDSITAHDGTGMVTIPVSLYQIVGANMNLATQMDSGAGHGIQVALAHPAVHHKADMGADASGSLEIVASSHAST